MAEYELWLTDDAGVRIRLLQGVSFFSYTRAVDGLGTCSFGMPFDVIKDLRPFFKPDWRMEVWRSPLKGYPPRREDVFLLRKPNFYTRVDNVTMIQYYGRNGMDLLKRRSVVQRGGTAYAKKTATVDNMMKAFVRQQMLYGSALDEDGVVDNTRAWPQNEFRVQADASLGPSVTRDFADKNVFDLCKDLVSTAEQYHLDNSVNRRIHFDVVPMDVSGSSTASGSPLGWEFQTFADLRGGDRTNGIRFSLENENITQPNFFIDHLDEVTAAIIRGNGSGEAQQTEIVLDSVRASASRWNRVEKSISASNEASVTALQDAGRVELGKGIPKEKLNVTILNARGSRDVPRSLYGVDWDLGDLLSVDYAGQNFDVELKVVFVSVNENGEEEITGRSDVQ